MMIAMIGSGNVGGTLARLWTAAGNNVSVAGGDTSAETVAQMVKAAEIVALCVPWSSAEAALNSCGDQAGKILIDCTNPLSANLDSLVMGGMTSAAEQIQAWHPETSVVKAFNTIGAALLGKAGFDGRISDGLFCGDNESAKAVVSQLISAAGLRPVNVGPLRNARYLEAMAMLWIDLAVNQKRGPTFSFALSGWKEAV